MKQKTKLIKYIIGILVILILTFTGIKFYIDGTYRGKIPDLSELEDLPTPLKEQIQAAYKKAYYNPNAGNLGKLGMVYHSAYFYNQARTCYLLAIQRHDAWIWNYYLGYLNIELGEIEKVREYFTKVSKKKPDNDLARYYLGEAYLNSGLFDQSETVFTDLIERIKVRSTAKDSSNNKVFTVQNHSMYYLARIYMNTDRALDSKNTLLQLIEDQPQFGPAYRLLGTVYDSFGDSIQGEYYRVRANDLNIYKSPQDPEIKELVLLSRSDKYLLKYIDDAGWSNNRELAMNICMRGLQYYPNNKYLLSKAIRGFLDLDEEDQVRLFLPQHLKNYMDDSAELEEIYWLLIQKEYQQESLIYLNRLKQLYVDDPNKLASLYNMLLKGRLPKEALSMINELLEEYEGNQVVLRTAIFIMLANGEKERADNYFLKLSEKDPDDPAIPKISALYAEQAGRQLDAIQLYEKAVIADPDDLETVKYLVGLMAEREMWKQLEQLLKYELDHHPNESFLLVELGNLLFNCPDQSILDLPQAMEYSERAFIHRFNHPLNRIISGINLAYGYATMEEWDKASEYLTATIAIARKQNFPEESIQNLKYQLFQYQLKRK